MVESQPGRKWAASAPRSTAFGPFQLAFVVAAVLLGLAAPAQAQCEDAFTPYSGLCGQGTCVNGTCVCFENWSGKAEFWDSTGRNCVTHEPTRLALLCLCYILAFFGELFICYRFYVLWNANARASLGGKVTPVQMIAVTLLGEFLGVFACMSFLIYGNLRMHESVGAVIGLIIGASCGFACSAFIGIFQIQMAIKSIHLRGEERSLVQKIYIGTTVANVLAGVALAMTLLGNLIVTDWQAEIGWMRAQMVSVLASSLLIGAIHFKYFTDLINSLMSHMQAGEDLGAQVDLELFEQALQKLRRLRVSSLVSFAPAAILPVLCIAMPVFSTYYLPTGYTVLTFTGVAAGATLKPPRNAKSNGNSKSRGGTSASSPMTSSL